MKTSLHGKAVYFGTGSGHPADDAPTILFIHGAGFDHSVWVMPARYFARHGFRVIAPDMPGHGRSEGRGLTDINAMADWSSELLNDLGAAKATAVGHSMGSLVVTALAHRHPELIAKIALLGTSNPMAVGPPLLAAALDDHPAAFAMANTWSHSTQGRLGRAENPGLSNFVSGSRWLERMTPGTYHADLSACNNFSIDSAPLTLPVLVIAGEQDQMTPMRAGLSVAERLQQCQTTVLAGAGHAMLGEKPNQVLDALASFIITPEKTA